MAQWDFRSQHPDEVQAFIGSVYVENEFKLLPNKGPSRTRIYGTDIGELAQYNVSYSSPFTFLSEAERDTFLILSCTAGTSTFRRGGDSIEFNRGRIAPISATRETRARCGDSFAHISTHISTQAINNLCSKVLGHPLDEPVLFALTPFSDELSAQWRLVVSSVNLLLDAEDPSPLAIANLKEYAIALLLERHPHNYSNCIERHTTASAQAVRDAKRFIEENADRAITVADVAAFAGCSVGALHRGFCEHFGQTPRAYLFFVRMTLARRKLTGEATESSAAEVARHCGIVNADRFESAYKARYEETPTDTFRRYLRSTGEDSERGGRQSNGALAPAKIDLLRHHINACLGDRITIEKLAAIVGMSPQSFAASFKRSFNTTPAQYVLAERLKWARWLLANTNTTISAIAAETGFCSQSHLTSALKRWDDQTPHALRKSSRLA